jgi:ribosome-binding factor A
MGRRQERVAELIKQTMARIFQQQGKAAFGNSFITVTTVRMSPDVGYAFIYLSVLQEADPQALIEQIRENKGALRKALGDQIRDQLKKVPELYFYYDDTMDYVERMEEVFKQIDKGNDTTNTGTDSPDNNTQS